MIFVTETPQMLKKMVIEKVVSLTMHTVSNMSQKTSTSSVEGFVLGIKRLKYVAYSHFSFAYSSVIEFVFTGMRKGSNSLFLFLSV